MSPPHADDGAYHRRRHERKEITQLWETPANGYEFNTPCLYSSDTASKWIYPSFEDNFSIRRLIDALKTGDETVKATVKKLRGGRRMS